MRVEPGRRDQGRTRSISKYLSFWAVMPAVENVTSGCRLCLRPLPVERRKKLRVEQKTADASPLCSRLRYEHALDEPVDAGENHRDRAEPGDLARDRFVPPPHKGQGAGDNGDDQ